MYSYGFPIQRGQRKFTLIIPRIKQLIIYIGIIIIYDFIVLVEKF